VNITGIIANKNPVMVTGPTACVTFAGVPVPAVNPNPMNTTSDTILNVVRRLLAIRP